MCNSMTGYGRADFFIGDEGFSIDIKSLNHRFLDVAIKAPDRFLWIDGWLRAEIKARAARGSFSITIKTLPGTAAPSRINMAVVRGYLDCARDLKKMGIRGEVDVMTLLRMKDIFCESMDSGVDVEAEWDALKSGVRSALDSVAEWREKEGKTLREDVEKRLAKLLDMVAGVEARAPEVVARYGERLRQRVLSLAGNMLDESRLATEVSIMAERCAFDEEVVRLRSHMARFGEYLGADGPMGRKLDFLCQELLREANTVASKSYDADITYAVVEMKVEIEKIREQVQNIE